MDIDNKPLLIIGGGILFYYLYNKKKKPTNALCEWEWNDYMTSRSMQMDVKPEGWGGTKMKRKWISDCISKGESHQIALKEKKIFKEEQNVRLSNRYGGAGWL